MMQTWNDFDRIENEHYATMFNDSYRDDDLSYSAPRYTFWIEWESDSEDCEDCEFFDSETEEEALDLFWEAVEEGRLKIPADAKVTNITNKGVA